MKRYLPPSLSHWQGRADALSRSCFFQCIQLLNLQGALPAARHPAFALLGFCCDEGIRRNLGRPGASLGPNSLRAALSTLAMRRQDITLYDAGDIVCEEGDLVAAQAALADSVAQLQNLHIVPIVMGGGHEMAWGHYQGLAGQALSHPLGIINFDAHFDLRPLPANGEGTSGSPFLQIAHDHAAHHRPFHYHCIGIQRNSNAQFLFDTAKRYNTHIIFAETFYLNPAQVSQAFEKALSHDHLYVSLCLDVFAAAYAPGVSAPQALGLTPWQIIPLLRQLALSGKVMSYDVAELSPPHDRDDLTAKLAAQLVAEIIQHHHFGKSSP